MRKYEQVISELQSGMQHLVSGLPSELATILNARHALGTVEQMERTFASPLLQKAFSMHRGDIRIRATIYTISELVRQIQAINTLITRVGGVQTYDIMRRQIEALYDAPPHKEPDGAR